MNILYDGSKTLYEMKESDLYEYFYKTVSPDFYTAHEVEGTCFVNHPSAPTVNVRADFLLYPRQHLIDLGFADTWFAVEIKRGQHQIEDAGRQAFWYTLSRFQVKEKSIVPGFACFWKPSSPQLPQQKWEVPYQMSEFDRGYAKGKREGHLKGQEEGFDRALQHIFGYLNVGKMTLNVRDYVKWRISIHGTYAERKDENVIRVLKGNRTKFLLRAGNGCQIVTHSGMTGETA
jgi:hypothetical protein